MDPVTAPLPATLSISHGTTRSSFAGALGVGVADFTQRDRGAIAPAIASCMKTRRPDSFTGDPIVTGAGWIRPCEC